MRKNKVAIITGTRKGIGKYLATYYLKQGLKVIGCSRKPTRLRHASYQHFCIDITDEITVKQMFVQIQKDHKRVDVLINNAGIAAMNHVLTTPVSTAQKVLNTNVAGTFLFSREAAKLMKTNHYGRIVNFTSVATPLKLEGEAVYAASKAAVITLTQIFAKELSSFDITVNAIGPAPTKTDLIRSLPKIKIDKLIYRQAINRHTHFRDISNVIDFFIQPQSDFVTGQAIYLGGV